MIQIIDGKKIQKEILLKIKKEVEDLPFQPIFCDVLVGDDPASAQYVQMKDKTAESIGIKFHNVHFPDSMNSEELVLEIKKLNKIENMCGLIIQLPLPAHFDRKKVLDSVDSRIDVDCLGNIASEKFYKNEKGLGFPTALACMRMLDSLNLPLKNINIVVLGQGDLVGKPVTALLRFRGLNPKIVTRLTKDKEEIIKNADIIISGMGNGQYITGDMIKKGVVLIDAGTSEDSKRPAKGRAGIIGDVDFESVKDTASFVSPVPGGVGPVTIAMLFENVLKVAKSML